MLYTHVATHVRPVTVMLLLEYVKAGVDEKAALIVALNALTSTVAHMVEEVKTQDPDTFNGSDYAMALFEIAVTTLELFGDNDMMAGMQKEQVLIELYNKHANNHA